MRRRRKEFSLTKIIVLFVICTLTFSVGYSLLYQQLSVEGTVNLLYDKETTCNEYSTNDLKITYDNGQSWHNSGLNYMQIDVTLTNLTSEEITDWKVMIKFISDIEITGSWSGNYKLVDKKVTITGLDWNKTISAGGQISFGFQISTPDEKIKLSTIYLNGESATPDKKCGISDDSNTEEPDTNDEDNTPTDPSNPDPPIDNPDPPTPDPPIDNSDDDTTDKDDSSDLSVEFIKGNSWGSEGAYYIQYSVKITNNSDININPWSYKFELPEGATIAQYWNCNYVNADGLVTISPTDSNSNLLSGSSTEMGFQILSPTLDFTLVKK